MKNRIKSIILVIFLFIIFMSNVNAEESSCDYKVKAHLNKLAGSVTATYDFVYKNNKVDSFNITVYNITEEIFVNVSSSSKSKGFEKENFTIVPSMTTDNKYTFNVKNIDDIVTYEFIVKSHKYNCTHDIRKFSLIKPMKNKYHDMDICKYDEVVDYYYCQEWLTTKFNGTDREIQEKIIKEKENQKAKTTTKCINCEIEKENNKIKAKFEKIKRYIILVIVVLIVVDLGYMIISIINMRRSTL